MDIDTLPFSSSSLHAHPNPHPHPFHRKIELQSTQDLTYLQTNLATSARAKLDLHFPRQHKPATVIPLDGAATQSPPPPPAIHRADGADEAEHDPMRAQVRSLVDDFLAQTWTNALHGVSVNGIDATSTPFPYSTHPHNPLPTSESHAVAAAQQDIEIEGIHYTHAPFDGNLQKRVAALYAEVQSLTTSVAKLRRAAPAKAAERYGENLDAALLSDELERPEEHQHHHHHQQQQQEQEQQSQPSHPSNRNAPSESTKNVLTLSPVPQTWNQDVSHTYARGAAELRRLAGAGGGAAANTTDTTGTGTGGDASLTETVGKAQRARTVVAEVLGD